MADPRTKNGARSGARSESTTRGSNSIRWLCLDDRTDDLFLRVFAGEMKVAGLDPGRHTAAVVVNEMGVIQHLEEVELEGDMVQRSQLLRGLLQRSWNKSASAIRGRGRQQ